MKLFGFLNLNEPLFPLLYRAKLILPVVLLTLFWLWETWHPYFGQRDGRLRHAGRNIAVALLNSAILALGLSTILVTVAHWTAQNQYGMFKLINFGNLVTFCLALVLLDGWMYVWHRANHLVPLLWRFHRMHHSDTQMDVTTATRFHLGEHLGHLFYGWF